MPGRSVLLLLKLGVCAAILLRVPVSGIGTAPLSSSDAALLSADKAADADGKSKKIRKRSRKKRMTDAAAVLFPFYTPLRLAGRAVRDERTASAATGTIASAGGLFARPPPASAIAQG